MNKNIIRLSVAGVVTAVVLTIVVLMLFREGPLGNLSEDDIKALGDEFSFRFSSSKKNEEGKEVTPVKFFTCLNSVLRSVDEKVASAACSDEVIKEEEAQDEYGRGEYVKNGILEARNIMFRVANPKEEIGKVLKKGSNNAKELVEAVPKAFLAIGLVEDDESEKQKKTEEFNTALGELLVWLWLRGSASESAKTEKFRTVYRDNQCVKDLVEKLDAENKAVAESAIDVKVDSKSIEVTVLDHIFTTVFQGSMCMGAPNLPKAHMPPIGAVAASGNENWKQELGDEEPEDKGSGNGKGIVETAKDLWGWVKGGDKEKAEKVTE